MTIGKLVPCRFCGEPAEIIIANYEQCTNKKCKQGYEPTTGKPTVTTVPKRGGFMFSDTGWLECQKQWWRGLK